MIKTSISFGLVHIPVSLEVSVRTNDIGFNMIDKKTKSRVQYQKTCVDCDGRTVKNEDIIKGYAYEKDKYVFFDESDFEKLKSKKDKTVAIEKFVSLAEIDPIYYEKAYYVSPQKGAEKAFALLFHAMQKEKKVGIAKTVFGTKENLVALQTFGDNLILNTLFFDDEIKQSPAAPKEKPSDKEIELAKSIIANMTETFDPKDYRDEYRERIGEAIQQKIKGVKISPVKEGKPNKVSDLMDALRQTLDSSAQNRKKAESKPAPKPKLKKAN